MSFQSWRVIIKAALLIILLVSTSCARLKPFVDPQFAVHAFYYLWYGIPDIDGEYKHWNHEVLPHWNAAVREQFAHGHRHKVPDSPHCPYYPHRGLYSSRDAALLAGHVQELSEASCNVIALSWWGPSWREGTTDTQGVSTDAALASVLAHLPGQLHLKVALHMEPYPGRTADTFLEDVQYLMAQHQQSAALLRLDGRPVYYVYDSYRIPQQEWAELLCPSGSKTVRGTIYDGVFLGLWLDASDGHSQLLPACFDGFYTYFASEGVSWGADPQNWGAMGSFAREHGLLFVPSVAPGYNDTRIRPWNSANTRDREDGQRYQRYWQAAMDAGADAVSITSFNEWGEGTQIEAARPHVDPASGQAFADYGEAGQEFKYMRMTADNAARFQALLLQRDLEAVGGSAGISDAKAEL